MTLINSFVEDCALESLSLKYRIHCQNVYLSLPQRFFPIMGGNDDDDDVAANM